MVSPELIVNSLILTLTTAVMALVTGLSAAMVHGGLHPFLKKSFNALALLCWLTPPFLYADSWMRLVTESIAGVEPLSIWSCSLVLCFSLWPVAFFLMAPVVQRMDIIEKHTVSGLSGWPLMRWIVLPAMHRAFVGSLMVVAAASWSAFTIPSLFNVKMVSAELWIRFNASLDANSIWMPALVQFAVPAVLLFMAGWWRLAPPWTMRFPVSRQLWRQALGSRLLIALVIPATTIPCLALWFGFLQLVSGDMSPSLISVVWKSNQEPLLNSVTVALGSTIIVTLAGIALNRFSLPGRAWILWFIPGICISILLSSALNSNQVIRHYDYGIEMVITAVIIRLAPLGIFLLATTSHAGRDPSWKSFTRIWPLSLVAMLRWIQWPISKNMVPGVASVLFAMALWETESSIMIHPPGGETAAQRIFGLLHYGHTDQVSGLCLLLVTAGLLFGVLVSTPLAAGRLQRKSTALQRPSTYIQWIGLAAVSMGILTSGCQPGSTSASDSVDGNRPTTTSIESEIFRSVMIIGRRGNGAGLFQKPRSLTTDRDGTIFVSDMTGRIQRFSADGSFERSWQMPELELGRPKGMAIDHEGHVMVAEPHYGRINHFSRDGTLVRQWGEKGKDGGQLDMPRAIQAMPDGTILVTEFGGHDRLQWFQKDGTWTGRAVGTMGSQPLQFNRPEGIALRPSGNILIADSNNHRIQELTPRGEFVAAIGTPGSGTGEFSYPFDVKIDSSGLVFVCEFGNSRIQIFSESWEHLETIGELGRDPGQFFNPWSISLDPDGNLVVADAMNHRVQKFIRRSSIVNRVPTPAFVTNHPQRP
jgi:ABC-type Fe3+ transport system permease subunit/sugar lactone lactonase YvrE